MFRNRLYVFYSLHLLTLLIRRGFTRIRILLALLVRNSERNIRRRFAVTRSERVILFTITMTVTNYRRLVGVCTFFRSLSVGKSNDETLNVSTMILHLLPGRLINLQIRGLRANITTRLLIKDVRRFRRSNTLVTLARRTERIELRRRNLLDRDLVRRRAITRLLIVHRTRRLPNYRTFQRNRVSDRVTLVITFRNEVRRNNLIRIFARLRLIRRQSYI